MNTDDETIGEFAATFRRQFRTMVYVAGPTLAIFIGIALGMPDLYRATGVIRIDSSVQGASRVEDTYAEYYVQTLTGRVYTSGNLKTWVDQFDLFAEKTDWTITEKMAELRANLETTIVTTKVIDPIRGREREVVTGFEVAHTSRSPDVAQEVASVATEAYLVENRRSRQARGQVEIDFFKNESETYRGKIAEVDARLADFKERNSRRLPELMQVNMNAMERVERDLETTQMQIDGLKRERVILQSQLSQIPSTSNEAIEQLAALQNEYVRVSSIYYDTHPSVVSVRKQIDLLSQTVDSAAAIPILRQQQEEISNALIEARDKYSDDHPDVRQLIRSENAIRDRIAALASRSGFVASDVVPTNDLYISLDTQIKAIDSQITGLGARIRDLRLKREEYEQALLQTPQVEREYQEILRDLTNARKLFEETQEKQREAELSLGLTRGAKGEQLILAQAPFVPQSPAWPPRAAIIVLGCVLAVIFGVGIATLRELSSGTVRGGRDALELSGTPPIAFIPLMLSRTSRVKRHAYAVGFLAIVVGIGSLTYMGAQVL